MRKTNALAGLVLGSRAAEQVEYPLMILRIDAAAIVADLEDSVAEFGPPAKSDFASTGSCAATSTAPTITAFCMAASSSSAPAPTAPATSVLDWMNRYSF